MCPPWATVAAVTIHTSLSSKNGPRKLIYRASNASQDAKMTSIVACLLKNQQRSHFTLCLTLANGTRALNEWSPVTSAT